MPVESAQFIGQLDKSYPLPDDDLNQGDDHLRLTKKVLQATFPGAAGDGYNQAILASEAELNFLVGVTSPIQEQFDELPQKYLELTGGHMTGLLEVDQEVRVVGDAGGTVTVHGYTIYDQTNLIQAGMVWDDDIRKVLILERGDAIPTDTYDTIMELYQGKVTVTSSSGKSNTPVGPWDLANKQYVDDVTGGFAAFESRLNIAEAKLATL